MPSVKNQKQNKVCKFACFGSVVMNCYPIIMPTALELNICHVPIMNFVAELLCKVFSKII